MICLAETKDLLLLETLYVYSSDFQLIISNLVRKIVKMMNEQSCSPDRVLN